MSEVDDGGSGIHGIGQRQFFPAQSMDRLQTIIEDRN